MSYIFDSSSIFAAIKSGRVELVSGNYTLDLTKYELGNALWKDHYLRKNLDMKELASLAKLVKAVIKLTQVLKIDCFEEEILETASNLGVTFYDASYAYYAEKMRLTLITEDKKLSDKLKPHIIASDFSMI
jgi:predicted nucleic acid-binding protein